jgi:hypothetical protein
MKEKAAFGFSVFRFKNSRRRALIKQQRAPWCGRNTHQVPSSN